MGTSQRELANENNSNGFFELQLSHATCTCWIVCSKLFLEWQRYAEKSYGYNQPNNKYVLIDLVVEILVQLKHFST